MFKKLRIILSGAQKRLAKFAKSPNFFKATMALLIIESVWIGLSAIYPGAFDEDTHLGIIKFFSSHHSPFISNQPASLDQFGPVIHDPSYLYHYIMSWTWQLITFVTNNFALQIIFMRFINIGLFVFGLILFRRVLQAVVNNSALINLTLLVFILTPIVPQLASQINYDNLLFVLLATELLLAIRITRQIKNVQINIWNFGLFVSLGLLAPLVKYTFLTMFAGMTLYIAWQIYRQSYKLKAEFKPLVRKSWAGLSVAKRAILLFMLILSFGLFTQRYGLNVIRYHTLQPNCVKTIGPSRCQQYSIYRREQIYAANKPTYFNKNPFYFTYLWLRHMLFNLTMAINGPESGYSIGQPLPLPYAAIFALFLSGMYLCILFWQNLFRGTKAALFGLVIIAYLLPLWVLNYQSYLQVGRRVAIQGRYLVPILPILYFLFFMAFKKLFKPWAAVRTTLASLVVVFFLMGGGALTFILHSDYAWYWPNKAVLNVNQTAQNIFKPIIPSSRYTPYWQSSLEF